VEQWTVIKINILEKMSEDIVLLVTVAFGYGIFFRGVSGAEEDVI
jgi:hypothetical protein